MRNTLQPMIATALMIGIFNPFNSIIAQETSNTKQETESVKIDVVVKDADGKLVPDLKKEDFEIYEDGVLQEIIGFKPIKQPLRLVLLFDTSPSMGFSLPVIKDESVKFVQSMDQLDEIIVASFSSDLQCPTDWGGKARAANNILDLQSVSAAVSVTQPRAPSPFPPGRRLPGPGGRLGLPDVDTNLYGTLHDLFERFGGFGGNEIVLLVSDGKDSVDGDKAKQRKVKDAKQVIQEAQKSWVQVNTACFNFERGSGLSPIGIGKGKGYGSNCKFLSEIADATGGRNFEFETKSDFNLVLRKNLDEWRSQYSLVYSPSSQGKAGFHKLRTVVKRPDVVARSREGYLVTK
jgi:VWFA-related protein